MSTGIIAAVVAPLVGAVAAFAASFALVTSATSAPDENPASQDMLTYGE